MYSFTAMPFVDGCKTYVCAPSDVEIMKRGATRALVTIEGISYNCNLLYKGGGDYYIPLKKPVLDKLGNRVNCDVKLEFF